MSDKEAKGEAGEAGEAGEMIRYAQVLQTRFQEANRVLATAQAKWILKQLTKQSINPNHPESITLEVVKEATEKDDPIKATFFEAGPLRSPNAMTLVVLKRYGLEWKGPRSYSLSSPKILYFDFTLVPVSLQVA